MRPGKWAGRLPNGAIAYLGDTRFPHWAVAVNRRKGRAAEKERGRGRRGGGREGEKSSAVLVPAPVTVPAVLFFSVAIGH